MTPTQNHTLVAALLSLLSIVMFSGITSAQPAPEVTGTLHGAVATVAPDGQSYSVPGASLKLKAPTQYDWTLCPMMRKLSIHKLVSWRLYARSNRSRIQDGEQSHYYSRRRDFGRKHQT